MEVGTQASTISHHTSHRDTAFQALVDVATLTRNSLTISPASFVIIYIADHFTIPWCQTMDRHNNMKVCKVVCELITEILFSHMNTTLMIKWILGHSSFYPLKCLMEVAQAKAAEMAPPPAPLLATPTVFQDVARAQALWAWEEVWQKDPRYNLVYQALHHPPSGVPPEFMEGIATAARPIFCMAIRLLTEHTFTGEYNARHCLRASDPHGCQCGLVLLQTPTHIICECQQFKEVWDRILRPSTANLSPNIIFRTKAGGSVLTCFIKKMQACMRPRRWTPEDHS